MAYSYDLSSQAEAALTQWHRTMVDPVTAGALEDFVAVTVAAAAAAVAVVVAVAVAVAADVAATVAAAVTVVGADVGVDVGVNEGVNEGVDVDVDVAVVVLACDAGQLEIGAALAAAVVDAAVIEA